MKLKLLEVSKSKKASINKPKIKGIKMNFILRSENSIYYEAKYSCDNAIYLRLGSESFFITDLRYVEEAKEEAKNCEIVESNDLNETLAELLKPHQNLEFLFDPYEWSVADFEDLKERVDANLTPKKNFSKEKRIIKSDQEIEYLSTASQYGKAGFQRFREYLAVKGVGKKERELNFKLQSLIQQKGSLDLSFDPIVAFNENTSKPHALPTDRRLSNGDLVLVDAGVKFHRYCSDRTETFMFQQTKFSSVKMSPKVQKIYDIVQKAHETVISEVRSGMKASEVDKLARDVISNAGYEKNFLHSTGHGVGLDIHEYPTISAKSDIVIEDNMVFTVEPAIYISNFLGVRIEDMIVMKNGRAKVL
jgi:Xaa-Pro aminopeptidase